MRVAFCIPTLNQGPMQQTLDSLEATVPLLDAAGIDHKVAYEVGSPYISHARITAMAKAIKWGAQQFVFIDHDVSWRPEDMLALIKAEGDVVAGTYRFKLPEAEGVKYMGRCLLGDSGRPLVRESDGAIDAICVPAGFLRVSWRAVLRFALKYPHLVIDADGDFNVDLFNHGAHQGVWFGEDYAFCRNWRDIGGQVWLLPDLNLDHWNRDGTVWRGNFHEHLLAEGRKSAQITSE